jgi:hypothetical protein
MNKTEAKSECFDDGLLSSTWLFFTLSSVVRFSKHKFRKLDLFPSSGSSGERFVLRWTPWTGLVNLPSLLPDDGKRSSFRNVVFAKKLRWTVSEIIITFTSKTALLCVRRLIGCSYVAASRLQNMSERPSVTQLDSYRCVPWWTAGYWTPALRTCVRSTTSEVFVTIYLTNSMEQSPS